MLIQLEKLLNKILISRLQPNQDKHGLNLLKFKNQFNNLKLGPRPKKLKILRDQEKLYKPKLSVLPLKFPTVSALPTPNFQLLNTELRMLREELKLLNQLPKWKLPSKALHGKMLKLREKPSLIQLKDNSLRRNLRNSSNQSKPTSKLLMFPNERQLIYNEKIYIVA